MQTPQTVPTKMGRPTAPPIAIPDEDPPSGPSDGRLYYYLEPETALFRFRLPGETEDRTADRVKGHFAGLSLEWDQGNGGRIGPRWRLKVNIDTKDRAISVLVGARAVLRMLAERVTLARKGDVVGIVLTRGDSSALPDVSVYDGKAWRGLRPGPQAPMTDEEKYDRALASVRGHEAYTLPSGDVSPAPPKAFGYSPEKMPRLESYAMDAGLTWRQRLDEGMEARAVPRAAREELCRRVLRAYGLEPRRPPSIGETALITDFLSHSTDESLLAALEGLVVQEYDPFADE